MDNVPIRFYYGDRDWMAKDNVVLPIQAMPRIAGAGHHIYLDNPLELAMQMVHLGGQSKNIPYPCCLKRDFFPTHILSGVHNFFPYGNKIKKRQSHTHTHKYFK